MINSNETVGIISIGIGNVGSVRNMVSKIGYKSDLLEKPPKEKRKFCILPGVGRFDEGIRRLKDSGWFEHLQKVSSTGESVVIGICLGMQLLCDNSEEGQENGLGLIPGSFKKFLHSDVGKVPVMGWQYVQFDTSEKWIDHLVERSKYYFVHSFHYQHHTDDHVIGWVNSNRYSYACAIQNQHCIGFQFHPEKSHKYGFALLQGLLKSHAK